MCFTWQIELSRLISNYFKSRGLIRRVRKSVRSWYGDSLKLRLIGINAQIRLSKLYTGVRTPFYPASISVDRSEFNGRAIRTKGFLEELTLGQKLWREIDTTLHSMMERVCVADIAFTHSIEC